METTNSKKINDSPYLNRSSVKKLALGYARQHRAWKVSRVGSSFFQRMNAQVVQILTSEFEREETPLYIKRSAVKKLAKHMADSNNYTKKVDGAMLKRINERLKEFVTSEVQRHPSIGKTLE